MGALPRAFGGRRASGFGFGFWVLSVGGLVADGGELMPWTSGMQGRGEQGFVFGFLLLSGLHGQSQGFLSGRCSRGEAGSDLRGLWRFAGGPRDARAWEDLTGSRLGGASAVAVRRGHDGGRFVNNLVAFGVAKRTGLGRSNFGRACPQSATLAGSHCAINWATAMAGGTAVGGLDRLQLREASICAGCPTSVDSARCSWVLLAEGDIHAHPDGLPQERLNPCHNH